MKKYYCPTSKDKKTTCIHGDVCKCDTDGSKIKKLDHASFTNEPSYPVCPCFVKPRKEKAHANK